MILPLFNKAAETRTKTRQDHYQQNHFGIGFTDRKDDDASNDLLLRIAAGAAHAERTRCARKKMNTKYIFLCAILLAGCSRPPEPVVFTQGKLDKYMAEVNRQYEAQHLPMQHDPQHKVTVLMPVGEIDTNQSVRFECTVGRTNLLSIVVPTLFGGKPGIVWRFSFDPKTDDMVSMRPEIGKTKAQPSPPN